MQHSLRKKKKRKKSLTYHIWLAFNDTTVHFHRFQKEAREMAFSIDTSSNMAAIVRKLVFAQTLLRIYPWAYRAWTDPPS